MQSNKQKLFIGLGIALLLLIVLSSFFSLGHSNITIDGEEISGIGGIAGVVLACIIAFVAVVLALGLTGIVLVGVALILVVVFAVVLGSFALALLPLLIPLLALYGLIVLLKGKKTT